MSPLKKNSHGQSRKLFQHWINLKLKAMELFKNLFREKQVTTYLGEIVKEGDIVYFISSDRQIITGTIERRKYDYIHPFTKKILKKGTLAFHNFSFEITDYQNLKLIDYQNLKLKIHGII